MELHILHQLLCQGQNVVLRSEDVVGGNAAGNLLKV